MTKRFKYILLFLAVYGVGVYYGYFVLKKYIPASAYEAVSKTQSTTTPQSEKSQTLPR